MVRTSVMIGLLAIILAGCSSPQLLTSTEKARVSLGTALGDMEKMADAGLRYHRIRHILGGTEVSNTDQLACGGTSPLDAASDLKNELMARAVVEDFVAELRKITMEPEEPQGVVGLFATATKKYVPPASLPTSASKETIDAAAEDLDKRGKECREALLVARNSLAVSTSHRTMSRMLSTGSFLTAWPDIQAGLLLVANEAATQKRIANLRTLLASDKLNNQVLKSLNYFETKESMLWKSVNLQRSFQLRIADTQIAIATSNTTSAADRIKAAQAAADALEMWDRLLDASPTAIVKGLQEALVELHEAAKDTTPSADRLFRALSLLSEVSGKMKSARGAIAGE